MSKALHNFITKILVTALLLSPLYSFSQEKPHKGMNPEKIAELEQQVRQLITFLEYSLNTLGSKDTPAKDKETIIRESYKKLFANDKVQIEDDLDEGREAIVNKDVQAYLKDIDFFFRDASFRFDINDIQPSYNASGRLFFIVNLDRYLQAYTVSGDTLDNSQERFVELNYDDLNQDLKIASIYTTKLNENEEISYWWNTLPEAWKVVFGREVMINDTLPLSEIYAFTDSLLITSKRVLSVRRSDTFIHTDSTEAVIGTADTSYTLIFDSIPYTTNAIFFHVRKIMEATEVNVEGNSRIHMLEPLSQLRSIKRINCSHTPVEDLTPIRNLSQLESLDISHTHVKDLSPLHYAGKLRDLNIGYTPVEDIQILGQFTSLEKLNMDSTAIRDLSPLMPLEQLRDLRFRESMVDNLLPLSGMSSLNILDCSGTRISSLDPLRHISSLKRLYCSGNRVTNLTPLSGLKNLQTLNIDNTPVTTLDPLNGMEALEKIYCDNTAITGKMAGKFMADNPGVLVIYESKALIDWWNSVPPDWQIVFSTYIEVSIEPTKEQLHEIANLTRINIEHNGRIGDIEPLRKLDKLEELNMSYTMVESLEPLNDLVDLKKLNCRHTGISSVAPLEDLINLEYLDISETGISTVEPLSGLKNLRELHMDETNVQSLEPLNGLSNLRIIYCDKSPLDLVQVYRFYDVNPECLVIFQTETLENWWSRLNEQWKGVFMGYISLSGTPGREDLHRISNLQEIDISGITGINSLAPLRFLVRLTTLKAADTRISDIDPLRYLQKLSYLNLKGNPLQSLEPLSNLKEMSYLNMVGVPVENLSPIRNLSSLKNLDLSGMPIKDLEVLSGMKQLETLAFNNTRVKNFKGIEEIPSLKKVECFNTRISERRVEKFRELRPGVDVVYY